MGNIIFCKPPEGLFPEISGIAFIPEDFGGPGSNPAVIAISKHDGSRAVYVSEEEVLGNMDKFGNIRSFANGVIGAESVASAMELQGFLEFLANSVGGELTVGNAFHVLGGDGNGGVMDLGLK